MTPNQRAHVMTYYLEKLHDLPPKVWAAALAIGILQTMVKDAFFWMWIILGISALIDWIAGRWAVRNRNPAAFSRTRSREGLYGKALGLILIALLRSMEAVLPTLIPGSIPSSHGIFASLIGVALFIDELDSIDRHRQTLGFAPIPLLSWVIDRLRSTTGAERREIERSATNTTKESP